MKTPFVAFVVLTLLPAFAYAGLFEDAPANPTISANGATFEVAFSSPGALSPAIVAELASARKSIRVAARDFTSKPVSDALVTAAHAKVDLKVVLNRKTNGSIYSASQFLFAMNLIPHLTKSEDALHAEYIVIDGRDIVLGNIAGFADEEEEEQNAASVIIIRNAPELAKCYLAHWQALWNASEEMKKPKD
jgi:phosphatidylserine/phosphatidylglycerophosphate/cardiolipin synthase-like enzyme